MSESYVESFTTFCKSYVKTAVNTNIGNKRADFITELFTFIINSHSDGTYDDNADTFATLYQDVAEHVILIDDLRIYFTAVSLTIDNLKTFIDNYDYSISSEISDMLRKLYTTNITTTSDESILDVGSKLFTVKAPSYIPWQVYPVIKYNYIKKSDDSFTTYTEAKIVETNILNTVVKADTVSSAMSSAKYTFGFDKIFGQLRNTTGNNVILGMENNNFKSIFQGFLTLTLTDVDANASSIETLAINNIALADYNTIMMRLCKELANIYYLDLDDTDSSSFVFDTNKILTKYLKNLSLDTSTKCYYTDDIKYYLYLMFLISKINYTVTDSTITDSLNTTFVNNVLNILACIKICVNDILIPELKAFKNDSRFIIK